MKDTQPVNHTANNIDHHLARHADAPTDTASVSASDNPANEPVYTSEDSTITELSPLARLPKPTPEQIMDDFCLEKGRSHAIVGSGGKTTLLWYLTGVLNSAGERVTVTTSARMMIPAEGSFSVFADSLADFAQAAGTNDPVILAGRPDGAVPGKIGALTQGNFKRLSRGDRYLLAEADGSRRLPLKWWYPHEPPVFSDVSVTYGVLPIRVLGEAITETNTYFAEGLIQATGKSSCDLSVLKEIVLNESGLFKNSHGKNILVINQCDSDALLGEAVRLIEYILQDQRSACLYRIITTSLKEQINENYRHYSCRRLCHQDEAK